MEIDLTKLSFSTDKEKIVGIIPNAIAFRKEKFWSSRKQNLED